MLKLQSKKRKKAYYKLGVQLLRTLPNKLQYPPFAQTENVIEKNEVTEIKDDHYLWGEMQGRS